jgi:exopolysaccharide biosynthesis polyprenyl glycosylphosphotransferase
MTSKSARHSRPPGAFARVARPSARSTEPSRLRGWIEADERQPLVARRRERRYRRTLAVGDLLAACLALVAAGPLIGDPLRALAFVTPLFVVFAAKVLGLYDQDELRLKKSTLDELPALFNVSTFTALVFWLGHPYLVGAPVGRDQVLALWLAFFALLPLVRLVSRWVARRRSPPERCLVVGPPDVARSAADKIASSPGIGAECVGLAEISHIIDRPGRVSDALAELAHHHRAERVVVAAREVDQHGVLDVVRAAKLHGLRVTLVPRMVEAVGSSIVFDDVDGTMMLGVRRFGLTQSSRLLKRAFDVAGAGFGLVLVAPALAILAALVKLDSRGPVLFHQPRIGLNGEPFRLHKFRTMVADAEELKGDLQADNEAGEIFKIAADPRITRVGGFLRRTSLDELPQLWDVLRGKMSLVGPRPLVPEETERIGGWHRRRLELVPGMTGRWQVLGSARIPLEEMNQLDYLYAANWSLWNDVKILLRTVPFVLGRRGL